MSDLTFEVRQGDSLRLLEMLPSGSVDGVFCDPPYSSGGQFRGDRMRGTDAKYIGSGLQEDYDGDTRDQRGFTWWASMWLAEAYRASSSGSPLLCAIDWRQLPSLTDAVQAAGWVWRGVVVWDKTEAARPNPDRPRNQCEYFVYATKGPVLDRPKEDRAYPPGVYRKYLRSVDKHHQAYKPPALWAQYLPLVRKGGVVLDPFCGAGSVGEACALAGLSYIGFEINQGWAERASERVGEAFAQRISLAGGDANPEQSALL